RGPAATPSPYTTLFRSAARAVETNDGPAGQRRLDGAHARPEVDLTIEELAPGHRVADLVGPDAQSHEALDGAAAPECRAEVGRQDRKSTRLNSSHQITS